MTKIEKWSDLIPRIKNVENIDEPEAPINFVKMLDEVEETCRNLNIPILPEGELEDFKSFIGNHPSDEALLNALLVLKVGARYMQASYEAQAVIENANKTIDMEMVH